MSFGKYLVRAVVLGSEVAVRRHLVRRGERGETEGAERGWKTLNAGGSGIPPLRPKQG